MKLMIRHFILLVYHIGDFMINSKEMFHQLLCLRDISSVLAIRHNVDKMLHIGIKWMVIVTTRHYVPCPYLQDGLWPIHAPTVHS